MDYHGKHVLVLGLGESGLAMAQWLACCGAQLRVADTRDVPARLETLRSAIDDVAFIGGAFTPALLDGIDFVAVSPGLSPLRELACLLPVAEQRGIPVWGEIELFAQALDTLRTEQGYHPKIIAITGTNGKTTVTSMVGMLCRRAGLSVQVAGNISPSALDMLRLALGAETPPQVWVLELSSFQLHTTFTLKADAAAVLNITQDHLDWHGSMDAYVTDKSRIFSDGTVRVVNRDDPLVWAMAVPGKTITFGVEPPAQENCFGLSADNGMQWLSVGVVGEHEEKKRGKKEAPAAPVAVKRLMPADALRIRGRHNAVNALSALALCRAIDLPFAPLLHALRDYQGEPHRVELVATIDGVGYYDDSKGTNVGATVAALEGLGQELHGGRLVVIAGGDGKGQDFSPLARPLARHARAVLLIGVDAPKIRKAVAGIDVDLIDCATLEEAVQRAAGVAKSGDAVLLSPACASLDMFRNYAHRAEVFVHSVRKLGLSRGEVAG
jgi:UDP-N-acetylmuramoylalanine--D-glutamate ligase